MNVLRRGRVVRRVELVVDAQVAARLRHARHDRGQVRPHRVHDGLRAAGVAGEPAEPEDLRVRLLQVVRGRLVHDLDPELPELRGEVAGVVRDEDEVRVVVRDRLDVRRVAGEARPRRALRVVRLVVDCDDLLAGADREQILGHGRRERDDPVREAVLGARLLVGGRREGDDGERGGEGRDDSDGETVHESFLPRGVRVSRRAAGLLTRGSLPRRLPGSRDPVASWRKSVSPYSGGTVPDLHRSSLTARRFVAGI